MVAAGRPVTNGDLLDGQLAEIAEHDGTRQLGHGRDAAARGLLLARDSAPRV